MPLCGLPNPRSWPNSCNLNCYADGSDSIDWHADDEPLFQGQALDCRIISLSLGEVRTFELKLAEEAEAGTSKCQLARWRRPLHHGGACAAALSPSRAEILWEDSPPAR